MKALLIDHDDSFTFNLKKWLQTWTSSVQVLNHQKLTHLENSVPYLNSHEIKNRLDSESISLSDFDLLVLSPGPLHPRDYPHTKNFLLKSWSEKKPVLGICLGAQIMAYSLNLKVEKYSPPLHGKTSKLSWTIDYSEKGFTQEDSIRVARYHSLKIDVQRPLLVDAYSQHDQIPMIIRHPEKKWLGFQFHPESFLSEPNDIWKNYTKKFISQVNL